ncbi:MAG TPA: ATP-binding protein [Actinomycetota bacterium]|nr:ATP-binding protein [Actinomycetota bacterium]
MDPAGTPRAALAGASEAERGRAILSLGILAFRWVSLAWMAVLALTAGELRRQPLAAAAILLLIAWTAWLTLARPGGQPAPSRPLLAADLALAAGLNVLAGLVMPERTVGERPFFAAGYPVAAAVSWGAAGGVRAGVAAGLVLGASLAAGQLANGIDLAAEDAATLLDLAGGALNFALAGGAVGLVARLLERSAVQLRQATEETIRARERAARLAERESLARQIHDSVLQALALVHKRGRELAAGGPVPPDQVAGLAEMAAGQERALRALVLRDPDDGPTGAASLRAGLEAVAGRGWGHLEVTVGATGPIWLPAHHVEELAAAVRQALDNVVEHAGASRVALFAEEDGGMVAVTVRDDGRGFTYDEAAFAAAGKIGLAKSIKGRVEQLGGQVRVSSRPGAGTEVELRIPGPEGSGEPQGGAPVNQEGGRGG